MSPVEAMYERQLDVIREERDKELDRIRVELQAARESNRELSRVVYVLKGVSECLLVCAQTAMSCHALEDSTEKTLNERIDSAIGELNMADRLIGVLEEK